MLVRLSVSNFAIIDELQLDFQKGLTIITGETGAGKSILLGALKLVLGERADLTQLKNSNQKCIIEATFNLTRLNLNSFFDAHDLDYEKETILRRELLPSGKSRAFINDTPVTLDILQQLSNQLIDIHAQFNTENLLNQKFQLQIIDAYANQINEINQYHKLYQTWLNAQSKLSKTQEQLKNNALEADYKKFILNELIESNLTSGEIETLESELNELQNIDEIQQSLSEINIKIDSEFGLNSILNEISIQLNKISAFGEEFENLSERVNSVKIELQDIYQELQNKASRLESNPERLYEVTERLNLLYNLLQKHRVNTIEQLIELKNQLENETDDFDKLEQEISKLTADIESIENDLDTKTKQISQTRKNISPQVETALLQSIAQLGMENASMQIKLTPTQTFHAQGKDQIEILFSANKGASLKPIGKSVSGGERSRLMLAVKNLLSTHLQLPTLILDEVDTGVSGKVADEVGNLMKKMSKTMQVISITHLPQVAAKGSQHFKVQKKIEDNLTKTEVKVLNNVERIQEIAELISGSSISESAISQAKELLQK